jgi:hypothetical protein
MLFAPLKCILLFDSTTVIDAGAIVQSRRDLLTKISTADRRKYAITYFDETMEPTTFLSTSRIVADHDHA